MGGCLYDLLKYHKKLTEKQAKQYAAQIILALGDLHKNGIVYGDLTPSYISLNKKGYLCLSDFTVEKRLKVTKKGVLKCTPEYSSPE